MFYEVRGEMSLSWSPQEDQIAKTCADMDEFEFALFKKRSPEDARLPDAVKSAEVTRIAKLVVDHTVVDGAIMVDPIFDECDHKSCARKFSHMAHRGPQLVKALFEVDDFVRILVRPNPQKQEFVNYKIKLHHYDPSPYVGEFDMQADEWRESLFHRATFTKGKDGVATPLPFVCCLEENFKTFPFVTALEGGGYKVGSYLRPETPILVLDKELNFVTAPKDIKLADDDTPIQVHLKNYNKTKGEWASFFEFLLSIQKDDDARIRIMSFFLPRSRKGCLRICCYEIVEQSDGTLLAEPDPCFKKKKGLERFWPGEWPVDK